MPSPGADSTTRRALRVGSKCSTWESFQLCPAGGGGWTIWTHHGNAWKTRPMGGKAKGVDEVVADDDTGGDPACIFSLARTQAAEPAQPAAPIATAAELRELLDRLKRGRALEPITAASGGGLAAASSAGAASTTGAASAASGGGRASRRLEPAVQLGGGMPPVPAPVALAEHSGKFVVLARMLHSIQQATDDRVILVALQTRTLDLLQALCVTRKYPCLRIDGDTPTSQRAKRVAELNDPKSGAFVLLLSSKAGGCGLNLIGANRLVLMVKADRSPPGVTLSPINIGLSRYF